METTNNKSKYHPISSPELLKVIKENFIDTLRTPEHLQQWLDQMNQDHKDNTLKLPKTCSLQQARALLIADFYLMIRPHELAELTCESIDKTQYRVRDKDTNKIKNKWFYAVKWKAAKGGKLHSVFIPVNDQTTELYNFMKSMPPIHRAFFSFTTEYKNKVKWITRKEIFVREVDPNGESKLKQEVLTTPKDKAYVRKGGLIFHYIKTWTGLPPYFFRHNRGSTIIAKGGTVDDITAVKGGRSNAASERYKAMSGEQASKIGENYY